MKAEKGSAAVSAIIKKSGIDAHLINFFPPTNQQQSEENFAKVFNEKNLGEVVQFRKQHAAAEYKNMVFTLIKESLDEKRTPKEIVIELKDEVQKHGISEQDTLIMVCMITFSKKNYVCILRAKVYTKSVFNKEFCNFIPAPLRNQSCKQVMEAL